MAVAEKTNSQLRITFHEGEDSETGKPMLKTKAFTQVKIDASTDQLYAVAEAYASLQQHPIYNIERRDSFDIEEA